MAEDERLREAILEMEVMRAREVRIGQINAALLTCIESYACAPTPDAALASLFSSLGDLVGADRSFLVAVPENGSSAQVIASDDPTWIGMITKPPFNITTRPRNLSNLEGAGPWLGALDLSGYASALIAPAKDRQGKQHALVCLKTQPSFARTDQPILLRLSSLFVQAVQTQALNAENALLAATIQGSSSGFAIADANHRERPLIYVNAAFEQITGYAPEEVLGRNCRFLNDGVPETPDSEALRQAVRERRPGQFVVRNRKRSGALFWNELSIYPVQNADGLVTHLVATQTNVTDRIEAAAACDQIKAQMQEALATADDAFLMLEPDGSVRYANGATRTLFPAENVGWRAGSTFAENWSDYLDQMRRVHGRVTQLLADADLDRLHANPSGTPLNLPDGRTVLVRLHRLVDGISVIWGTDLTSNAARLR